MNAEIPAAGLRRTQKLLNFDGAYGIALLAACAVFAVIELGGETARKALAYERGAIAAGEGWRLLSAHFVHLDAEHAALNALGVVLMWALFARDFSPWRWAAIYLGAALGVSAGLWFGSPEVSWYVGASGALHGAMTAGTLAHLRRRDLDAWILAIFIVAKLSFEQFAGAMPFSGSGNTIVAAHLYGAVGGLVVATFLASRREPA